MIQFWHAVASAGGETTTTAYCKLADLTRSVTSEERDSLGGSQSEIAWPEHCYRLGREAVFDFVYANLVSCNGQNRVLTYFMQSHSLVRWRPDEPDRGGAESSALALVKPQTILTVVVRLIFVGKLVHFLAHGAASETAAMREVGQEPFTSGGAAAEGGARCQPRPEVIDFEESSMIPDSVVSGFPSSWVMQDLFQWHSELRSVVASCYREHEYVTPAERNPATGLCEVVDVSGFGLLRRQQVADLYSVTVRSAYDLVKSLTSGWRHQQLLLDVMRRLKPVWVDTPSASGTDRPWRLRSFGESGTAAVLEADDQLRSLLAAKTNQLRLLQNRLVAGLFAGAAPGARCEELYRLDVLTDISYHMFLGTRALDGSGPQLLGSVAVKLPVEKCKATVGSRNALLPPDLSAFFVAWMCVFRPVMLPEGEGQRAGSCHVFWLGSGRTAADVLNKELRLFVDGNLTVQFWRRFTAYLFSDLATHRGTPAGQAAEMIQEASQRTVAGVFGHSLRTHRRDYTDGMRASLLADGGGREAGWACSRAWHLGVLRLPRAELYLGVGSGEVSPPAAPAVTDVTDVLGKSEVEVSQWLESEQGRQLLREALHAGGACSWRPGQVGAVTQAILDKSFLLLGPTGSGKSLTFMYPALLARHLGVTRRVHLVVCPLLALIRSHVRV